MVSPGKSAPLRRHWKRSGAAPTAEIENVAVVPLVMTRPCGWEVIAGGVSTVAMAVAELFAGIKSSSSAVAALVLDTCPTPVGVTSTDTVADAPAVNDPSEQLSPPPLSLQLPWLELTEINVTPAGKRFVSATPLAADGPALLTVMMNVRLLPTPTGLGDALASSARSATGTMLTA